jgi:hypothetical protein
MLHMFETLALPFFLQLSLSTSNFIGLAGTTTQGTQNAHVNRSRIPEAASARMVRSKDITPQEYFFVALEQEMDRIDQFVKVGLWLRP